MTQKTKVPPRDTPLRDDFYLGMAFWYASKSKDPRTQCGACIVSSENVPLGMGYNGPPKRIRDTDISWGRPEKYPYIDHAEVNAIEYSHGTLAGATMYVTAKPCKDCMRVIVRKGIYRVVYFPFKPKDDSSMLLNVDEIETADEIARLGHVRLEEFKGNLNWMRDRIQWMEGIGIFDSKN